MIRVSKKKHYRITYHSLKLATVESLELARIRTRTQTSTTGLSTSARIARKTGSSIKPLQALEGDALGSYSA